MARFLALAFVALVLPTLATAHDGHDECPPQDTSLLEIAPIAHDQEGVSYATERYYVRADADIRVETNAWVGLQSEAGVCVVTKNGIVQFDETGKPVLHRWVADMDFLDYYLP